MDNAGKKRVGLKLALVEDHVLLRQSLKTYIQSHEREWSVVLEAQNGQSLADQLSRLPLEEQPDIVLLDINMPHIDGYETLKWLKKYGPNIRVIMLSMYSDDQTIIRCLRIGANGYLSKTADGEELIRTIRAVWEKGEHYSQRVASLAVAMLREDLAVDLQKQLQALTPKEMEFLRLVCTEWTYKEIADRMFISPRTVDIYRDQLFEKLGVRTRVGLAMYALRNKIVHGDFSGVDQENDSAIDKERTISIPKSELDGPDKN
jgi:two-component system invasion response regulator UvrY